jgi:hypothetical protein
MQSLSLYIATFHQLLQQQQQFCFLKYWCWPLELFTHSRLHNPIKKVLGCDVWWFSWPLCLFLWHYGDWLCDESRHATVTPTKLNFMVFPYRWHKNSKCISFLNIFIWDSSWKDNFFTLCNKLQKKRGVKKKQAWNLILWCLKIIRSHSLNFLCRKIFL